MTKPMQSSTQRRYSLPAYTNGWFQVGWSDDLKPGQLRKVRQFGEQYTLFRGKNGIASVIDDVCPHLGAHFSEGGCVVENSVRCPYHHWSFDGDGMCSGIPYAKKIPVKAQVKSYHVIERYGLIFMYRHADGRAPDYDLPSMENFAGDKYEKPSRFEFCIRIHSQDIMENSVDSPHFWAVHRHAMPENIFRAEGKELRITQIIKTHRLGIPLKARLEFHMIEPGFHYLHFPEMPGTKALVFSSLVPVDTEFTDHRLTIWTEKTRVPGLSLLVRKMAVREMMRTYHEDMQIWQSKEYLPHPVLCDGDGAIIKLRRWYSQFFDQGSAEQAVSA